MSKVKVMDHPLIQHKIGVIRRKDTCSKDFRTIISEIAMLMCYEATRELKLTDVEIETPICTATVKELQGKKLAVVPIGLYRDPKTLEPVEYYCKLPADSEEREVFVVDPMLATGGSATAAIQMLKDKGVKHIHFMCIIAAPEGVKKMQECHPDVDMYIGALDEQLNSHGYIVPDLAMQETVSSAQNRRCLSLTENVIWRKVWTKEPTIFPGTSILWGLHILRHSDPKIQIHRLAAVL